MRGKEAGAERRAGRSGGRWSTGRARRSSIAGAQDSLARVRGTAWTAGCTGTAGTPGAPGAKGDKGEKGDKGDAAPAGLRTVQGDGAASCEASETLVSVFCPGGGAADGAKCSTPPTVGLCLRK